jgi:tetratricopeptide (TPR) repeat protein
MVAAAVVLLVLAAAGFAVSTALITREQSKTKAAFQAETAQRERADNSFRQALRVVNFFTELSQDQLASKPELQWLRRKLLEEALEYYQQFIDQRRDDPTLYEELDSAHLRIAKILAEIRSPEEALAALDRAHQYRSKAAGSRPPGDEHHGAWGRPGPRGTGLRVHLLSLPAVQEDLHLSNDQVRRVAQFLEKRQQALRNLHNLSPEEWRITFAGLGTEEKDLLDFLQPSQAKRLRQIALQQRAPMVFAEPDIAQSLSLTDEQSSRIRIILEEPRRAMTGAYRAGLSREESRKKVDDAWKHATDMILSMLTPEQRVRWTDLCGEPFTADLRGTDREGPPTRTLPVP